MKKGEKLEWDPKYGERLPKNHTITASAPPLNILNMRGKLDGSIEGRRLSSGAPGPGFSTKRAEAEASRLCGEPPHDATKISGTLKTQRSLGAGEQPTFSGRHSGPAILLDSNDSAGGAGPGPGDRGSVRLHDTCIKVDGSQEGSTAQKGLLSDLRQASLKKAGMNAIGGSQIQGAADQNRKPTKRKSSGSSTVEAVHADVDPVAMDKDKEKKSKAKSGSSVGVAIGSNTSAPDNR